MRLAIGPVQRVRNGRGSVEETGSYVEYVRAVLVRHDAVVQVVPENLATQPLAGC